MKPIELERWEPAPDDPRRKVYAGQRTAQEVFEELRYRLEGMGYLPDEYLFMDREWANGREIPRRPVETAFLREQLERAGAPDVFLVMLGSNDLLQSPGYTAGDVAARMAAFLRRLAALPTLADTQLLLVPPPAMHPGAWVLEERLLRESAALAPAYKALARELGIAFADCGDWDIPTVFDGVHFSEAGHRIFAREMCRVLEELLGG